MAMAESTIPALATTPASPPVKQLLTLDIGDGAAPAAAPVPAAAPASSSNATTNASANAHSDAASTKSNSNSSGKPDFNSPSYREAVATALRWDPERQEPYLQLPSYPELRITPFREGIEDQIVTLFNHPVIGERLYRLPYPMKRSFAESWVQDDLHRHLTFCTALAAGVLELPSAETAATTPLEAHHDVIILGLPFKSLWDTKQNRIIGDIGMSPDLEPLTPGGPPRTEDQVLASPLSSQTWHLGYVLEPAAHGRGIMTEVLAVLLESWVRPIMRIENVVAIVENNNPGSTKVIDRNGFKHVKDIVTDWPEEKGGGKRYSGYYVWKRGGDGSDDERVMRNLRNRRRQAMDLDFDSDSDADVSMGGSPARSPMRSPMRSPGMASPAVSALLDDDRDTRMLSPAKSPLRESSKDE